MLNLSTLDAQNCPMKTTVQIQNLKCKGCEATIIDKLSKVPQIADVSVNHEEQSVSFVYLSDKELEIAKKTLESLGYPLVGEDNRFGVKAKSYVSCAIGRMKSH